MLVQFNLLPDVKLKYVKAQRTRRLVTFIATVVGIVSLTVLLFLLFLVKFAQVRYIDNINQSISKNSQELKSVKDIEKMLTVQKQLNTLTSLHESKPVSSRVFTYLSQTTPAQASLNKLTLDYNLGTLTIGGTAPSFDVVQVYTNTLKSAEYTTESKPGTTSKAFSEVVLSNFSRNEQSAVFTITTKFAPELFDTNQKVELKVKTTDQSSPDQLFKEPEQ